MSNSAVTGCFATSKGAFEPILRDSGESDVNLPKCNIVALPGPKTQKERWAWLVCDAQRILRSPLSHREEEVAWARDMMCVDATQPGRI